MTNELGKSSLLSHSVSERQREVPLVELNVDSVFSSSDSIRVSSQGFEGDVRPP